MTFILENVLFICLFNRESHQNVLEQTVLMFLILVDFKPSEFITVQ